jgi:hypothetical protein
LEKSVRWVSISSVSENWESIPIAEINRPTSTPDRNSSSTWPSMLVLAAGVFLVEMIVRKFGWDRLLDFKKSKTSLGRPASNSQRDRNMPQRPNKENTSSRVLTLTRDEDLSYTERLLKTKKSGVNK